MPRPDSTPRPSVFFLDAHLVVLASLWSLFGPIIRPKRVSLLYLRGPERVSQYAPIRKVVARFLCRDEVLLFLRTEELRDAWLSRFPRVPRHKIGVLPSLELPEATGSDAPILSSPVLRFGVVGQIRTGKGLEHLVPLFSANPAIGRLTVAGTFFDRKQDELLRLSVPAATADQVERLQSRRRRVRCDGGVATRPRARRATRSGPEHGPR